MKEYDVGDHLNRLFLIMKIGFGMAVVGIVFVYFFEETLGYYTIVISVIGLIMTIYSSTKAKKIERSL